MDKERFTGLWKYGEVADFFYSNSCQYFFFNENVSALGTRSSSDIPKVGLTWNGRMKIMVYEATRRV